jgi:hypothetical protein
MLLYDYFGEILRCIGLHICLYSGLTSPPPCLMKIGSNKSEFKLFQLWRTMHACIEHVLLNDLMSKLLVSPMSWLISSWVMVDQGLDPRRPSVDVTMPAGWPCRHLRMKTGLRWIAMHVRAPPAVHQQRGKRPWRDSPFSWHTLHAWLLDLCAFRRNTNESD